MVTLFKKLKILIPLALSVTELDTFRFKSKPKTADYLPHLKSPSVAIGNPIKAVISQI
jgi:hypothetical protein